LAGTDFHALRPVAEVSVMAEPREQMPAAAGHGHLRASHADREHVIGTLKAAFVQGMLAKDEFGARTGQALAARTYAELAALTADLPVGLTAAQPSEPARAQGKARILRPGTVLTVATVVYAAVWLMAFFLPRDSEGEPMAGVNLVVMTTFVYAVVLVGAVMQMLDSRREKRSGRQRPRRPAPGAGGQASRHLPSVGPAGSIRRPVPVSSKAPKLHRSVAPAAPCCPAGGHRPPRDTSRIRHSAPAPAANPSRYGSLA
jgi:hypothetical protein